MNGEPLHAAKDAAAQFVQYLGPQDLISVVAFDDEVITMADPGACQPEAIAHVMRAIQSIPPGGTTNLSGGWLKGRHHVESNTVEGVNRILLLTDGLANQGITDPDKLRLMTEAARRKGITTTCIGFGPHFNEDLLQAMADAGGGNFWYVESHDQMGPIFEEEIEGLVSLAAQNVEVTLTLSHDRAAGVTFPQDYLTYQSAEGTWHITLGDLYGNAPLNLASVIHIEDVAELGQVEVGTVVIEADVIQSNGIEHRTITLPIVANLDGSRRIEPIVEATFLRYSIGLARRHAVQAADDGDLERAAVVLRKMAGALDNELDTPGIREEQADLEAEAARLEQQQYSAADRKYHQASAKAMWRHEDAYLDKIRRNRP
jgi:Ca-activated chloride channel family protein